MRRTIRLLIAAAAVVLVCLVGVARPAGAAEDPDKHCLEILEKGGTVDECQQAPNPLLPELNEIIWGGIGFLIVVGFIWKVGLPAIKKGMDARTERIRNDLEAAEQQRNEAQTILAEYQTQLADARNESARIIEEARQTADDMKRDLAAKAQADISEMRQQAAADIESAKAQAIADLRGEVANLAIGAAEQVVGRNLDRDTNEALVEQYINQVGATN